MSENVEGDSPPKPNPLLRLFVAIPLWGEFRERNLETHRALRNLSLDLKWVRPENWHITLKFLGPVPESKVETLTESIAKSVRGTEPFTVKVNGLGGFPRLSKCRVLWVGVTEGRDRLNALARQVSEGCREAGVPGDKKNFQAHLTLARTVKNPLAINVPNELYRSDWGVESVDSVALVKSTLGSGGAKYEVLERVGF